MCTYDFLWLSVTQHMVEPVGAKLIADCKKTRFTEETYVKHDLQTTVGSFSKYGDFADIIFKKYIKEEENTYIQNKKYTLKNAV